MSDAGSERGGNKRAGYFQDDKVRDLGNWERKGPLSPAPNQGPPVRDGGRLREGPPGERRQSPAWGEGRTDSGSRPPRERPQVDRAPTAAEQDTQWRARMRPDASPAATPDVSTPSSPQPQAPKERPRLNLAKRTVSTVDPSASTPTDDKASPFGAARPIDTSAREKEVEEKRQIAIRQKKEADDKAKEDKAAAKAKAAAEEKVASPSEEKPRKASKANGASNKVAKENGDAARPSFSILQREDAGPDAGESDMPDASANGNIIGDKETKPQEIVQEVSKSSPETTDEALDGDGWSTVQSGKKSRGTAARALAS